MGKNLFRNQIAPALAIAFCVLAFSGCSDDDKVIATPDEDEVLPQDASVIFLHHSTGGVIWGGGVAAAIDSYNSTNDMNYAVTEQAYPDAPYPWNNYPYDYWHLWVEGGGQATAEGLATIGCCQPKRRREAATCGTASSLSRGLAGEQ